jgi:hypothetical protein
MTEAEFGKGGNLQARILSKVKLVSSIHPTSVRWPASMAKPDLGADGSARVLPGATGVQDPNGVARRADQSRSTL